jgi:hypothetical protein
MFPRQRIHVTIEELLDASFSIRPLSYQRRFCGSVCVSLILVCVPPKRWPVGSQSRQTIKMVMSPVGLGTKKSLCWRGPATICWTGLCIPLSLLGNSSINTFPRKIIVGGIVFYAVRVVSKESRRFVLARTSRFSKKRLADNLYHNVLQ